MATLRAIKKRIASVKNTEQITRAMYMVSAAKLRRAQENAENSRPYAEALTATIRNLLAGVEDKSHPLLTPRAEVKNVELMLVTSDRGLCGSYNAGLIRAAESFRKENKGRHERIDLSTVGKRAADYFKRRRIPVRKATTGLLRAAGYDLAKALADDFTERYTAGEIDAVYLIYAVFKSALVQRPTLVQLLPFKIEGEAGAGGPDIIYEPSAQELLTVLLTRQVRNQVYRALLEAVASEHGARMTAMDSASSNAAEMIDHLTLQFNRARQATITKELMEIIGGAEALKK
jgi:F-type H+-transporting ATPase subunit gamma